MQKPLSETSCRCNHSSEQRVLRRTWCTPDIQEAVRQGYLLVKIHDIWHFPKTHRRTGLFADYVNTWLQIKQQFPGYPACASHQNSSSKMSLITRLKKILRSSHCKESWKKGNRQADIKFFLGYVWWESHKKTTESVTSPSHLFALVSNTLYDLSAVHICSHDVLEVDYINRKENQIAWTSSWLPSPPVGLDKNYISISINWYNKFYSFLLVIF